MRQIETKVTLIVTEQKRNICGKYLSQLTDCWMCTFGSPLLSRGQTFLELLQVKEYYQLTEILKDMYLVKIFPTSSSLEL